MIVLFIVLIRNKLLRTAEADAWQAGVDEASRAVDNATHAAQVNAEVLVEPN